MKRSLGAAAKRRNPKLRGRADFDLEARSVLAVVADRHPDLEFNRAVALEARKNISRYVRRGPGRLRGDDAQQGPADVVALRARRRPPHHAGRSAGGTSRSCCSRRRAAARDRCAAARCCWPAILAAALTSTAIHMLVVSQARYNLPLMPALLAGGLAGWVMFLRGQRANPEASRRAPSIPGRDRGRAVAFGARRPGSVARCAAPCSSSRPSPHWPRRPPRAPRSRPIRDAPDIAAAPWPRPGQRRRRRRFAPIAPTATRPPISDGAARRLPDEREQLRGPQLRRRHQGRSRERARGGRATAARPTPRASGRASMTSRPCGSISGCRRASTARSSRSASSPTRRPETPSSTTASSPSSTARTGPRRAATVAAPEQLRLRRGRERHQRELARARPASPPSRPTGTGFASATARLTAATPITRGPAFALLLDLRPG